MSPKDKQSSNLPTLDRTDFNLTEQISKLTLFWRARYLEESNFLHHIPFLFWMIDVIKPSCLVTLGIQDAVPYFATCQAIEKLEPSARCYGIDTWQDSDGSIPKHVENYNSRMYHEFSELAISDPSTASSQFNKGSVDILLLNLKLLPNQIEAIVQDWMPRLSDRAIVLIHGVRNERFSDDASQTVLSRLSSRFPMISFDAGEGLLALLVGDNQDERTLKLAQLKRGDTRFNEIFSVFHRLGQIHHLEQKDTFLSEKISELESKLSSTLSEHDRLNETFKSQASAYDSRNRQLANIQSKNHDLLKRLAEADSVTASLKKDQDIKNTEIASLKEANLRLEQQAEAAAASLKNVEATMRDEVANALSRSASEIATLTSELEKRSKLFDTERADAEIREKALREEIAMRESDRSNRFVEIATLTRKIEQLDKSFRKQLELEKSLRAKIEELSAQREVSQTKYEEIVNSTSWRMTGFARRAVNKWRSRK